ncbi:MAG: DUF2071 domain-containing protein [Actinomycetota bacterium]|nr:DUF2071 domain-containing protein [Actinomycetota bacterium]
MVLTAAELLRTPGRQASVVAEVAHRPWPLPDGSWIMAQTWDHLLFAHWPVGDLAVPGGLELDRFDGMAWIGMTPFRVSGLRLRGTLPLPLASSFLELNVRTYVTAGGKPGIWFFSLDAESRGAVEVARRWYRLPYYEARMTAKRRGEVVEYSSARQGAERPFVFEGRYRPAGRRSPARPGSLEHFLAERYCLYAEHQGRLFRAEIHHPPWPLQPAEAELELNTMAPDGVELTGDPLLHYSERQDVVIWPLRAI